MLFQEYSENKTGMTMLEKIRSLIRPLKAEEPYIDETWDTPFEKLREKWGEVPDSRKGRNTTKALLDLSAEELISSWKDSRRDMTSDTQFYHRGWYHTLYKDVLCGKKVLDVGCGLGIDGVTFAENGAQVTFVDIVEDNLEIVRRVCKKLGIKNASFLLMQDIDSLKPLDKDYDTIMAMGSLHHAPEKVVREEVQELLKHLKQSGRWLQLAYPKYRWIRDGRKTFDKWGEITDGIGTPWAEWYDLTKLLKLMEPARFNVVLCREFHEREFVWFDLMYKGNES
ncbi:class I SAM-dependent methyltransferase [Candidatus Altiarchaeota archaeon]